MKVLVVGDYIEDQYEFCEAARLVPGACAPVLHVKEKRTSAGGAGLVAKNIESLGGKVVRCFGSSSRKRWIFAGNSLVARLDSDSESVFPIRQYMEEITHMVKDVDAVIVSDYGKGAMSPEVIAVLMAYELPLFVDAKHDVSKYKGCYAIFPNQHENQDARQEDYQHIIRKLGSKGCSVDGKLVPTQEQKVYDVTGAGDVFIAAFVIAWLRSSPVLQPYRLQAAAVFANAAAGASVRSLGTCTVTQEQVDTVMNEQINSIIGVES